MIRGQQPKRTKEKRKTIKKRKQIGKSILKIVIPTLIAYIIYLIAF